MLPQKFKNLVIAIDGPSASGKGTLAKKLAQHFDLAYLNTGALYRLIAWRMIHADIAPQNLLTHLANLTQNIQEAELDNEDLFDEKIGAHASIIAKIPELRQALFDFQKNFIMEAKLNRFGCVLDGRDTTTVICPEADFKFFIKADVEIRAQRRSKQFPNQDYEQILAQLKQRDHNDINRPESPLKIADDAIVIDNGKLSIEEGFAQILKIINSQLNS